MKRDSSFIDALGYIFAAKVLSFLFLLGTICLAAPIFLLWEKTQFAALRIVGIFVLLIGLLASFFAPKEIVARMAEDESMPFSLAIAHTWYHFLMHLAFVPVIGPLLQRFAERKKKNPFTVDEQKRE